MGEVVRIPVTSEEIIGTLEDALAEAKKSPKKAVVVCLLEDTKEEWSVHSFRAGSIFLCLALVARMLHQLHKTIDG